MQPSYWQNYPEPFYPDWAREPVPGWGVRPVMAGPARVGVGAWAPKTLFTPEYNAYIRKCLASGYSIAQCTGAQPGYDPEIKGTGTGLPTWFWWVAVPVVLGGGLAVAKFKRWI